MKAVKWIVGVLLLAAVAFGGWRFLGTREASGAAAQKASGPQTEKVSRATIAVAAEASGVLEPIRVVEVKSKASGETLEVTAETGDKVEAGALLAKIDPRDVENAYQQAAADLEAARVKARITKSQKERLEALHKTQVATQLELELAVEAAANAQAALVRAQTNLQLAQERRRDVTIRAPIGGTLLERHVEPGGIITSATQNVSGGTVLFKMADLSAMQVRARVDETDIGKISPGQSVQVTVEAFAGRTFRGTVHKVEPQSVVEQNVTLFQVLVRLDNASGALRPGMNAEVTIEVDRREDVLTVPNGAIVTMRDAANAAKVLGVTEEALQAALRPPNSQGAPQGPKGPDEAPGAATQPASAQAGPPGAAGRRGRGGDGSPGGPRPGVVFVKAGGGVEPKRVLLGLGDWDRTEVVRGLEEGQEVVMIAAAQLRASQQQMEERMRSRMGSGIPGTGGGAGGARGGGR